MTSQAKISWKKVYDLSQTMFSGMTVPELSFQYLLHRRHADTLTPSSAKTSSSGFIMAPDHSGTHIDGLTHIAYEMKFHAGVQVKSVESIAGYKKLGIETVPPIVNLGVLIDLTKTLGNPLPPKYLITVYDLKNCMKELKVKISKGESILLRTGYDSFWDQPSRYAEAPGVTKEATIFLAKSNPKIVGADNMSWDLHQHVDEDSGMLHVGHYILLVKKGIHIVENLNLQLLSEDECYKFTFVCLPLKIKGATGSPVRPIALS